MRLARVAAAAARSVPGVAALDAGPSGTLSTALGAARVTGVRVAAGPGGRYDVAVGVVARLVPLHPLAEAVRALVAERARVAGLDGVVGDVTVHVADVATTAVPS